MGEPLANYVKSLDCRCELASVARTKTGNELLLLLQKTQFDKKTTYKDFRFLASKTQRLSKSFTYKHFPELF
jgi:hypothetical protein